MIDLDELQHRYCARRLVGMAVMAITACSTLIAAAESPEADDRTGRAPADTQVGVDLLANVEDETFAFDDDGFYWFCRYLRDHPTALSSPACGHADVVPWQYLMERPSDYRGRAICIEGRLLREQPEYEVLSRSGVGRLRQIDLGTPGSGAIATIVIVDPPPDTPRTSLIRVRGFFIKVRSFRTESGEAGAGPLIVAKTFDVIEPARNGVAMAHGMTGRDMLTAMAGVTFVLFVLVVTMRKRAMNSVSAGRASVDRPRVSGTSVDFDWMGEPSPKKSSGDDSDRG